MSEHPSDVRGDIDGPKRATASCRLVYAADGSDLPVVGDLAVVCDGPPAHGLVWSEFGDDLPVVFERFELRCPELGSGR